MMRTRTVEQAEPGPAKSGRITSPLWLAGSAIFLIALAIRVVFIFQSETLVDFRTPTPGLDIGLHWEAARQIRADAPFPCFELMMPSAPLHPYFVAACQVLLGENMVYHRLFRALLGALAILILFIIAWRITDSLAAASIMALLLAGLPSSIYFDSMILKTNVEILMLSLALFLLVRPGEVRGAWRWIALGLLLGGLLTALRFGQGGTILYGVFILIYLLRTPTLHGKAARLAVILPLATLFLGSQLLFKYREPLLGIPSDRFLPVGGVHMRIGFQSGAIGTYHVLKRFPALPLGHTFFARMAADARDGYPHTAAEADRSYIKEATDFIRQNPRETLSILGRKFEQFFNTFESAANHYLPHVISRVPIAQIPSPGWGGFVVLAFWGLVALCWRRQWLLLSLLGGLMTSVLFMNLLSFVTFRYRYPAIVPLALLAAFGLAFLGQQFLNILSLKQGWPVALRQALLITTVTLAVGWYAYRPVLTIAQRSMTETAERNLLLSKTGERAAADIAKLDGLDVLTPEQEDRRGMILHALGRYTDSFRQLETLACYKPDQLGATRQYLIFLMWAGKYNDLVRHLDGLAETNPKVYWQILRSFDSLSPAWRGYDSNLKLIIQAIMRDIVRPRLEKPDPPAPAARP